MTDDTDDIDGPDIEQIMIALNTFCLCIEYALRHVRKHEGEEAAAELKRNMLNDLKSGDITMSVMEDARAYRFIVSKIEKLA